jgi:hypothetical protein
MEGRVRVSAHARPDEVTLAFLQQIHMQVPATTLEAFDSAAVHPKHQPICDRGRGISQYPLCHVLTCSGQLTPGLSSAWQTGCAVHTNYSHFAFVTPALRFALVLTERFAKFDTARRYGLDSDQSGPNIPTQWLPHTVIAHLPLWSLTSIFHRHNLSPSSPIRSAAARTGSPLDSPYQLSTMLQNRPQ